jgi:hypothetical protein
MHVLAIDLIAARLNDLTDHVADALFDPILPNRLAKRGKQAGAKRLGGGPLKKGGRIHSRLRLSAFTVIMAAHFIPEPILPRSLNELTDSCLLPHATLPPSRPLQPI